ncbi:uncharacterized protein DEA37_0011670 [Paragonimus westermani]|uniref:Uncharacterized protein n=1 Tax=Paragonimus westermani TaxID=34504 RepID=A0A5J4NGR9_9TREM|nr:uncharacterized protein DEA37_0011670 [Paragonimus westermani]
MIPNTEVLRLADMDGMEAMLMLNQLRWLGHVRQMGDDHIPKQLLYGQVKSGKRNPGGQMRRYQDVVQSIKIRQATYAASSESFDTGAQTAFRSRDRRIRLARNASKSKFLRPNLGELIA